MTTITKNKGQRKLEFIPERLHKKIDGFFTDFPQLDSTKYKERIFRYIETHEEVRAADITEKLILNAMDNVSREEPDWSFLASRILLNKLYKEAAYNRSYDASDKYGSFYGLLKTLGEKGIYSEKILKEYSREEIKQAESLIDATKDQKLNYIGLKTLVDRYLAKDYDGRVFELPQERWMVIVMTVMSNEDKEKRMEYVKKGYWALSNLYMTVATPTLSNACLLYTSPSPRD